MIFCLNDDFKGLNEVYW